MAVLCWASLVMMCWRCQLASTSRMHRSLQPCSTGLCMVINQLGKLTSVGKDAFTKQCNVDGGGRDQAAAAGGTACGLPRATRLGVPALSQGQQSAQLIRT